MTLTHSEAGALQNEPAPGTEATKVGQEGTSLLSRGDHFDSSDRRGSGLLLFKNRFYGDAQPGGRLPQGAIQGPEG